MGRERSEGLWAQMGGIQVLTYTYSHLLHCTWDLFDSDLELLSLKKRIMDSDKKKKSFIVATEM